MIIGKSFVWLHFPKCAGTTTTEVLTAYFGQDPKLQFDVPEGEDPIWHDSIAQREERLGVSLAGRDVLANIRRLPEYVVSKINYTQKLAPRVRHTKDHFLTGRFIESNGFNSSADFLMKLYDADNVRHWMRTEHLATDFVSVFSRYLNLCGKDLSGLGKRSNMTKYDRSLEQWYTRREMARLYEFNPIWARHERRAYGNLLHEVIDR